MSQAAIHSALDTQLLTVSGLPAITYDGNTTKLKGAATPGFAATRVQLKPIPTTVTAGQNGIERKAGLYQIDLIYGTNTPLATALALQDQVIAAFPKGTYLTNNGFKTLVLRSYPFDTKNPMTGYNSVSVIVEWECWV